MRDLETAAVAVEAGADAIGFVFVRASPRYVPMVVAKPIVESLPAFVTAVALTNDFSHRSQFFEMTGETGITCVQLHGKEPPAIAAGLYGYQVIRALPAEKVEDHDLLGAWAQHNLLAAFLWDAPTSSDDPLGGGSGRRSDWPWLKDRLPTHHRSILAGGLTPDNVGEAIRTVRPFAVDVSSGVESSRGTKDPAMIADFCAAVREADAANAR